MKNTDLIGIRLPKKIKNAIQSLADKDERSISWMARKLIMESLQKKGLLRTDKPRSK